MQIVMQQTYATCFLESPKTPTEPLFLLINKKSGF